MTAAKNMNRRAFLASAGALVAYPIWGKVPEDEKPLVRVGLVTDIHHAYLPEAWFDNGRFYDRALPRLEEAIKVFNERRSDLVIELGDFKDIAKKKDPKPGEDDRDKETVIKLTKEAEAVFAQFNGPRYHVFGNHDNDMLDKSEFTALCPNPGIPPEKTYYAFDQNGVTFIILDGNFNLKGEDYTGSKINWDWRESLIPPTQIAWLKETLAAAKGHVVVCIHQRLDSGARPLHRVANGAEVQKILADSQKVAAVFQGHDHIGGYMKERGVGYYTLRAIVTGPQRENNAYAEAAVYPSGAVVVTGFAQAVTVHI
ncbi:MAG TPA: metallophosphoesterase [Kiritimatiellia bacterium]|jgi:alkaline phosphatase|nr:metallophosphoesterase [Kiritimatiellia bacterium]